MKRFQSYLALAALLPLALGACGRVSSGRLNFQAPEY